MFIDKLKKAVTDLNDFPYFIDFSRIEVVKYNLVYLYQVMNASESLLEEAIKCSHGELKKYYIKHLQEEKDHAEWLANDLKSIGVDVKKEPIKRHAAAMAGTQYYFIKHVKPECLLGYMAVIEGFPNEISFVEHLEKMHGTELFKTLRFHAEHDLEHRVELFEMIEKHQCNEIIETAIETKIYLNELMHVLRYI
jgi:hypothetical protein